MADRPRETLEKRAQNAIFQNAIFRWESAVVIALTVLLAALGSEFIPSVPAWLWLLGGTAAEAALVYSSLTDREFGRKVVAEMLQKEFHPERLQNRELQEKIKEAFDYRSRIASAIRESRDTLLRDSLSETAGQIDDWLENIYNLAQRLDRYVREKDVLVRDTQRSAERVTQLEQDLRSENDPAVRSQIEDTITSMRRQISTIESLENTMERAALQLENTLTALGTIYSQTMLVGAKDIDSGRAKRLRQEISEEVNELNDVLVAMDEVYAAEA